jgi:DNA-binding NarL/FixJ family response regulator
VVDDQQLVRAGFAMVIDSQPDMHVVGEAADGAEAVALVARVPADVVLMDVRMPTTDGLTATEQILGETGAAGAVGETGAAGAADAADGDAASPGGPKILMLTTFDLDEYLLRAIKAGASGFLLKDAPPEDMLAAIRTVHQGDAVIAPSSTRRLIERVAAQLPASPADASVVAELTEREREVLKCMARGLSNAEIAATLFVAETTVKTHVGRILAKTASRDRVQAVVTAYESGLVKPGA